MSFENFVNTFDTIDFVHIDMNAFYSAQETNDNPINWICQTYNGKWVANKTAGGK